MSWSRAQQIMFHKACSAAGWSQPHRYLAMRHAGCPNDGAKGRPSVKHPRNAQSSFEAVMALAEADAATRHERVPLPRIGGSWRQRAESSRRVLAEKAQRIAAEAIRKCPGRFDDGLLAYTVAHVTKGDSGDLPVLARPGSLDECDDGQLVRVVESLRAMVGRVFVEAGCTAESFEIPRTAQARGERARGRSAHTRDGGVNAA